ncbi:hypothetical protein GCM10028825_34080 [Spirosoma agri]
MVIGSLTTCRDKTTDLAPVATPSQRITSQSIQYVRILDQEPSLDTVQIDGVVQALSSKDSLRFQYDAEDRLVSYNRTQYTATAMGPFTNGTQKSLFSYNNGRFQELEGGTGSRFEFSLDNAQRRVLNRTKRRGSYIDVDTLRQYSSEGMLTTVEKQGNRQVFTIENGNVVRIEQFSTRTGTLEMVTEFTYDTGHRAPAAPFTFLGETNRNALLTMKTLDYSYATGVRSTTYTYRNEYDSQERMTRQIEYHQDSWYNQGKPYFWTATDYYYQ